jgi:hypothetical protein
MLAEVVFSCGRAFLMVAGIAVAMELDVCRDGDFPDECFVRDPDIERILGPIEGPQRRNVWNRKMLDYAAAKINGAATAAPEAAPDGEARDA